MKKGSASFRQGDTITGGGETRGKVTTNFHQPRSSLENARRHLIEELEQLKSNLYQVGERLGKNTIGDWGDSAVYNIELEKHFITEKRLTDRLSELEHALHKFDNATYGLCDDCGQPIPLARLEVLPQASLCVSCKTH